MKLYGTPPTRAVRPIWLINELGIDCEIVDAGFGSDEVMRLNPAGKLPILVDGAVTVTESIAIQMYLAEKFPAGGFIPETLVERAEMNRWNLFLATEIEQPLWRIALNSSIYDEDRRVAADILNAEADAKRMLAVFETHMTGRDYVAGDRLSVADFNAAYTLDWALNAKLLDGFPRLMAYRDQMYARPMAPETIAAGLKRLGIG